MGVYKGVFNKMNEEVKEVLKVCVDLVSISNELGKLEDGCGVDYSDVITDLKWTRMTLENRLRSLKGRIN